MSTQDLTPIDSGSCQPNIQRILCDPPFQSPLAEQDEMGGPPCCWNMEPDSDPPTTFLSMQASPPPGGINPRPGRGGDVGDIGSGTNINPINQNTGDTTDIGGPGSPPPPPPPPPPPDPPTTGVPNGDGSGSPGGGGVVIN